MLALAALLLQVQSGTAELPRLSKSDSVASARMVARARRQEAKLFADWRYEWKNLRDLLGTDPRMWSLHCHYDEIEPDDQRNLVSTYHSRKSMCPTWFQGYGERVDENLNIDGPLKPKAAIKIREKRAAVIALLDSAAAIDPGNSWILGQRIRLNVDQKEYARASLLAAEHCYNGRALCAMFEGWVLANSGNRKGAEAAFEYAASKLTMEDRCNFLYASMLLEGDERRKYEAMSCSDRAPVDERFWWLADPLWIKPGNERLAVHMERQTLLLLKAALTTDEHFDYRVKYGGVAVAEMLLRYGWPSVFYYDRVQNENHNGWLGFTDSTTNSSHEYTRPRYHSTPSLALAQDFSAMKPADLADLTAPWKPRDNAYDQFWWPIEHFQRAGPVIAMDLQAAMFRRKRGPWLTIAADPRSGERLTNVMLPSYTTALVAMNGPRDTARSSTTPTRLEVTGGTVATLNVKPGLQVVSAEVLDMDRDSAPAARARFAITAPPSLDSLAKGALDVSDAVLFMPPKTDDDLPRSAIDALERMLPSTELTSDRVGVFFEMYGVAPNDSVEITLTVISEDQPGFLRRFGSKLGVGQATPGSFVVRWEPGQPGTTAAYSTIDGHGVATRAIILNLATLKSGKYALEVGVSWIGKAPEVSRREFTLKR